MLSVCNFRIKFPVATYGGWSCYRFLHTSVPPRAVVSHLLLRFEMLRANLNTKTWAEINICFGHNAVRIVLESPEI
jgi:hypothetical protein